MFEEPDPFPAMVGISNSLMDGAFDKLVMEGAFDKSDKPVIERRATFSLEGVSSCSVDNDAEETEETSINGCAASSALLRLLFLR